VLRAHKVRQAEERLALGPAWEDCGHVFPNELGRPLDAANLRRRFATLSVRADLPAAVRFHDLRHTYATLQLLKGTPAKVASEALGHGTIGLTLDTYSHVLPDMQDQAAAAMDDMLGHR
jgi:integrase